MLEQVSEIFGMSVENHWNGCRFRRIIQQHLYPPFLYSYNIVETDPAHAALEPSPAGSRAFAGLNLYDGVDTDRDILRPGIICTRTLADVQVGDADLYEKRCADRRLRSSCFRCVDVYR